MPGSDRRETDRGSAIEQRGLGERLHTSTLAEYEHTFVRLEPSQEPGRP